MKELRNELDLIDKEMRSLFEKRLDVIQKVAEHKLKNDIPVLDSSREAAMIENGLKQINNENYREYYQEFLEVQLKVSKDLQTKFINKKGL